MNYVEIHLGDYAAATFSLSPLEDGIYWRMLRVYYRDEAPLPADIEQIERKVGARTEEEKAAVGLVLAEFFEPAGDGWRQSRCDEELAAYRVLKAGADAKRENEADRQRRHRELRAKMFEALRAQGVVMRFDATTKELRDALSRVTTPVTRDIGVGHSEVTANPSPIFPSPIDKGVQGGKPAKRREAAALAGCPDGVDAAVWADFLAVRKAKRAPMTATALEGIRREAQKAGFTLDGAIRVCVERGWQGFRADWVAAAAPAPMSQRRDAKGIPDPSDPDTKERIEADGVRLGLGPWTPFNDKTGKTCAWPEYAARVQRAREQEGGAPWNA